MYKRSEQGWLKHFDFILLDVLCAQLGLIAAYWARFGFSTFVYTDELFGNLAVWLVFFVVFVAMMFNTMRDVLRRGWLVELRQTLTQCLLVFSMLVIFLYSIREIENISRIVLWLTLIFYFALSYVVRSLWKRWLLRKPVSGNGRVMLLVSNSDSVRDTLARFRAHPVENIKICGIVLADRDAKGEKIDGIPVEANMSDAANFICREWIDEVYINAGEENPYPGDLLDKCREMGVTVHLQMISPGSGKQQIESIAGMPVLTSSMNFAAPLPLMVKRIVDILGGLALSLMAIVAIAIVGPQIKRQSPGPILFVQKRIGKNGKVFNMYKIRSMYMDAEARKAEFLEENRVSDGMMFKLDHDPRIIGNELLPDGTRKTGIGEFIRRYSLDETPQFFNIVLGQMSLVGTRPPTLDEWERYEYHHRARLAIKPGLTGLWQISGRSNITDFEEVVRLDTEYINNWSLGLDIRILLKTLSSVLRQDGAM